MSDGKAISPEPEAVLAVALVSVAGLNPTYAELEAFIAALKGGATIGEAEADLVRGRRAAEAPPSTERARAVRAARDRIDAERAARPAWETHTLSLDGVSVEVSGPAGTGWGVVLAEQAGCGRPGCDCGGGVAWAIIHIPSNKAVCFLRSPLIAALAADALAAFVPAPEPMISPEGVDRVLAVGQLVSALEGSDEWYRTSLGLLRELMNGRRPMLVVDTGGLFSAAKAAMNEDGAIEVDGDREGET